MRTIKPTMAFIILETTSIQIKTTRHSLYFDIPIFDDYASIFQFQYMR